MTRGRKPSGLSVNYRKWIRKGVTPDGRPTTIAVTVSDGRPSMYEVLLDGGVIASYSVPTLRSAESISAAKSLAVTRWENLRKGIDLPAAKANLDDYLVQADYIRSNPHEIALDVRFGLLAALEMRDAIDRGRTKEHASLPSSLARLIDNSIIPQREKDFSIWFEEACKAAIGAPGSAKASVKKRLNSLARIMSQLNLHKMAFKNFNAVCAHASSRLIFHRRNAVAKGKSQVDTLPYSLTELEIWLTRCESIEQLALLCAFLHLGTRAKDADKAAYSGMSDGKYMLRLIQSKTETSAMPDAPLGLRTILALRRDGIVKAEWELPSGIQRKRFRTTLAVMLQLSGVSPIEAKERLGHATIAMQVYHYSKRLPVDYAGKTGDGYFQTDAVSIDGHATNEAAWDNWVFYQFLTHSQRFGVLGVAKHTAIRELLHNALPIQKKTANF